MTPQVTPAKTVHLYTDGACRHNPGPGGWAALLRHAHQEKLISGSEPHTTNNQMELLAVIKGLSALKEPCRVEVFSDSQYVIKGMTQWRFDWEKKEWRSVKNKELWKALIQAASLHHIRWHWIRGHSNHPENERVDKAAREAIP